MDRKNSNKTVSLIIPAFMQEKTIVPDLKNINSALGRIRYNYEIILVVDGNVDGTYEKAKKFSRHNKKIKVYKFENNRGKGYAVRYGMQKARGDYIAFLDSGMEIDPNGISMLLEHLEWYNADVIVGSKRHPVSVVNYPWERKILSIGYYLLVRVLFNVKVKDTQSGIKIYRREVLEKVLPVLVVKKYAFDIEILSVARLFGFKRIYEAPIKLDFKYESLTKSSTLRAIWNILYDTLAIFYRLKILRYYSRKMKETDLTFG